MTLIAFKVKKSGSNINQIWSLLGFTAIHIHTKLHQFFYHWSVFPVFCVYATCFIQHICRLSNRSIYLFMFTNPHAVTYRRQWTVIRRKARCEVTRCTARCWNARHVSTVRVCDICPVCSHSASSLVSRPLVSPPSHACPTTTSSR